MNRPTISEIRTRLRSLDTLADNVSGAVDDDVDKNVILNLFELIAIRINRLDNRLEQMEESQ